MGVSSSTIYSFGTLTKEKDNTYTVHIEPKYRAFLRLPCLNLSLKAPVKANRDIWNFDYKHLEKVQIVLRSFTKAIARTKGTEEKEFLFGVSTCKVQDGPCTHLVQSDEALCLLDLARYLHKGQILPAYTIGDYKRILFNHYYNRQLTSHSGEICPAQPSLIVKTYLRLLTQYLTYRNARSPQRGDLILHMYKGTVIPVGRLLYDGRNLWVHPDFIGKKEKVIMLPRSFCNLATLEFDPYSYAYNQFEKYIYNDPDNVRVIHMAINFATGVHGTLFTAKYGVHEGEIYSASVSWVSVLILQLPTKILFAFYTHNHLITNSDLYDIFRSQTKVFYRDNTVRLNNTNIVEYDTTLIQDRFTEILRVYLLDDIITIGTEYIG